MDPHFMRAAMAMGARGAGSTWPNPSVGCVIVASGQIMGVGWTAPGGRPHAETAALAMAGTAARGASAYVTLEPCAHHGETPPCVEALIAAGIARVVIACGDPDPRVNGRGVAMLRAAGIEVVCGIETTAAHDILAPFFCKILRGRPLVTLKLAATLDGRIATASGESRWITGGEARAEVHRLRGQHDAVMTGIGTVLADDPELTCRVKGFTPRDGVRVVCDSLARTPVGARLFAAGGPVWILHSAAAPEARLAALTKVRARLIEVAAGPGGVFLPAALSALAEAGLTSVFAECGGRLAAGLLRADAVDRLVWFSAPTLLGGDAMAALAALEVAELAAIKRFTPLRRAVLGEDFCQVFTRDTGGA
jgi:diaminohydroxyphosphoribosylaminopyrimidine deaminase/5-amino-6-(5-phosphoribosylamino)uracil reductase